VARELRQDVSAFWRAMARGAAALGEAGLPLSAEGLAERVVGRTRDGRLLCPAGVAVPDDNSFGFHAADPHGLGCPLGSHVRRGNPRDGLARRKGDRDTLRQAANRHRLLRRGRSFGPALAPGEPDDGAERGLLFLCLNTDIARQFEFVQQTWMLNPDFATLFDETDPLLGPPGAFTIPAEPLRHKVAVESFVTMAGGGYFFLPSLPALRYLETL
jgi:deferrochelatase/peroxidase EfeB